MRNRLQEIIDHLKKDGRKLDEPHTRVMIETAVEVLCELRERFEERPPPKPGSRCRGPGVAAGEDRDQDTAFPVTRRRG